jgi:hypothetical protein
MHAQEIFDALQTHRDIVGKSVAKLIGTSFHREPDMDLHAPAGYILKSIDDMPVINKALTDAESAEFDAMMDAAIAKAEELAARDFDLLEPYVEKACELHSAERGIAEFITHGLPDYMRT